MSDRPESDAPAAPDPPERGSAASGLRAVDDGLRSLPLCVDLDGTLVATDTLYESVVRALRERPVALFGVLATLVRSLPAAKARLASLAPPDPATLPYREEVLDYVREARADGREVVLATASDRRTAEGVARHTGAFDRVMASDGRTNRKGSAKRQILEDAYGPRGFEYVGDSSADFAVWPGAGAASCVGLTERGLARVEQTTPVVRRFSVRPAGWRAWLRGIRVHQWVKNLLVFLVPLMAHRLSEADLFAAACIGFLSLSLCASGVYVLNDLVDLPDDRQHPTKRKRGFASGVLPLRSGLVLAPALAAAGLFLGAMWLPPAFVALAASYLLVTTAYTLWLKRLALLDVVVLALLFGLRVVAGGLATDVPVSPWLLGFSLLFFLGLAFLKRYADLRALAATRGDGLPGRAYRQTDVQRLGVLGLACGVLAVGVMGFYVRSEKVAELYTHPEWLWALVPILAVWLGRAWWLAHRGEMLEDPVLFTVADRTSWAIAALSGLTLLLAI